MSTPDPARRRWAVLEVAAPTTLAAVAAAATPLPWWRADRGAVLLGAGPVTELPPDTWTGVEMIGPWAVAVAVPAGIAVLAAALAILGWLTLCGITTLAFRFITNVLNYAGDTHSDFADHFAHGDCPAVPDGLRPARLAAELSERANTNASHSVLLSGPLSGTGGL